jgi:predicted nucleic acid-binding protein
MRFYVADTHALYWYLIGAPALGNQAKAAFDEGRQGQATIYLPAIVLAELYYLNRNYGQPLDFAAEFARLKSSRQFVFVPLKAEEVLDFDANDAVPEMHDRMIAGLARRLNAPCLTRDPQTVNSGVSATIW